jgi:glycosyltransferase involved in cell wall biosynthesis
MNTDEKILVIIPAYNEADTIGRVIEKTQHYFPFADILVVNDGSTDSTSVISRGKGILVLDLPYNLGIGAAMQAGYKFAYRMDYDIAVQCDADGQHHPAQIKRLIDTLISNGADMVLGSRYLRKKRYKSEVFRRMGILIFSRVISVIVGQRLTDPTSGFRAVSRGVIKSFSMFYPGDYPEPEALVLLHRQGFTIREIYVNMSSRKGGNSSINVWRSIYYMVKVLLAIFIDLCKEVPYKEQSTKEVKEDVENTNDNRYNERFAVGDCLRAY